MSAPRLEGVLETGVYCSEAELEETLAFYGRELGLLKVAGWGDGTAYRVGAGVLLVFCRERLAQREGPIADHGSEGPNHVCLLAGPGEYEAWRDRLTGAGVEIAHEHEWGEGTRSFYFRDPAGNLIEIANRDLWPRRPPAGA
jgi:catechol 2,3-dioxygenase-like lactoylglutathione lyase family enzyme